ncbi:hypothetical protein ACFQE1_01745 [Halobium palmae]|uniref:Uncharacterized protein n=1 Tax=Halobium palmae TaxID=1776492 RepID=A0ABD5RW20_9EURY
MTGDAEQEYELTRRDVMHGIGGIGVGLGGTMLFDGVEDDSGPYWQDEWEIQTFYSKQREYGIVTTLKVRYTGTGEGKMQFPTPVVYSSEGRDTVTKTPKLVCSMDDPTAGLTWTVSDVGSGKWTVSIPGTYRENQVWVQ